MEYENTASYNIIVLFGVRVHFINLYHIALALK